MRLIIIPSDGFVSIDGTNYINLDLSTCEIPKEIHALQWYDTRGWVEFIDDNNPFTPKVPNEDVFTLPIWADLCINAFNTAKAEEEAIKALMEQQTTAVEIPTTK